MPYEVPRRSMQSMLFRTIRESSVDQAIRQYYQLTEAFPYEYGNTEDELLALGQDLEVANMKVEALEILKLNSRVNPGWKAYIVLADAYYGHQNYEQAALLYRKSIENNPRNTVSEKDGYKAAEKSLTSLNQ